MQPFRRDHEQEAEDGCDHYFEIKAIDVLPDIVNGSVDPAWLEPELMCRTETDEESVDVAYPNFHDWATAEESADTRKVQHIRLFVSVQYACFSREIHS